MTTTVYVLSEVVRFLRIRCFAALCKNLSFDLVRCFFNHFKKEAGLNKFSYLQKRKKKRSLAFFFIMKFNGFYESSRLPVNDYYTTVHLFGSVSHAVPTIVPGQSSQTVIFDLVCVFTYL